MKFVKIYLLLIFVLSVASCSNLKAPEYVGVEDVNFSEVIQDSILINAALKFNNPNKIGGVIKLQNLRATVNNVDIGKIKNQEVKVPAKKDFVVPLTLKLSYTELFDDKKGLLNTILGSLLNNQVEVKLDGNATFSKFMITKEYPIKFHKKIEILK